MKKLLSLITFLFTTSTCFSQYSDLTRSLGIGTGIDATFNKDQLVSPLRYRGIGLPLVINGTWKNDRWINHFHIDLTLPGLKNNYPFKSQAGTELKNWAKGSFNYQSLRRIGEASNHYLGAEFRLGLFFRSYHFLDGYSWEFINSLNLSYARFIPVSIKSFFLVKLSVPLIAYIHKKHSLSFDEAFLDDLKHGNNTELLKYGQLRFVTSSWAAIKLNAQYQYQINQIFSLSGVMGLDHYSINYPEKVTNLSISISCVFNYHF